jgi:predicted TIM-barrel fold metal-dependent hydrolase
MPVGGEEPLDGRNGHNLALDQFRPRSMLVLPDHTPKKAKFPVVDVHVHPRIRLHHSKELLAAFVKTMDQNNIAVCVSLDGQLGESFAEHKKYLWTNYPDRFAIFANIDWRGSGSLDDPATWDCHRPDFGRRMAEALKDAKAQGASGLKIFKDFGLGYRNPDGTLIKIDDPRWEPIWQACGELGLPIIIHTADPAAFFLPIDEKNERWEELHRHPDWSFYGQDYPTRNKLLDARNRVIAKHPQTIFFGAHFANNSEDLKTLGEWLDAYPNLNIEFASRIGELGRQPYTARRFFLKYADRIMFGTDGPRATPRLLPNFRFLETADEYFPYAENPFPPQGLWNIYGIYLPDDVLKKVYYENANRLIPGVKEKWERVTARERK